MTPPRSARRRSTSVASPTPRHRHPARSNPTRPPPPAPVEIRLRRRSAATRPAWTPNPPRGRLPKAPTRRRLGRRSAVRTASRPRPRRIPGMVHGRRSNAPSASAPRLRGGPNAGELCQAHAIGDLPGNGAERRECHQCSERSVPAGAATRRCCDEAGLAARRSMRGGVFRPGDDRQRRKRLHDGGSPRTRHHRRGELRDRRQQRHRRKRRRGLRRRARIVRERPALVRGTPASSASAIRAPVSSISSACGRSDGELAVVRVPYPQDQRLRRGVAFAVHPAVRTSESTREDSA